VSLDILIRGGTVIDGTGAAPRRADIAIAGDRIAAVEPLNGAQAGAVYDVPGRYVVPAVHDRATYCRPRRPASGVEVVVVNGVVARVGRAPTGETPGRALRRAA